MVLNQARLEHVRRMRTAAQLCKVALCRDVAGRQLVAEMMARTRSSSGPASAKADAEKAYKLYEATFEGRDTALPVLAGVEADGSAQAETQSDKQFRLRGRSFLFTYNWDFFRRPLPTARWHQLAPASSGATGASGGMRRRRISACVEARPRLRSPLTVR